MPQESFQSRVQIPDQVRHTLDHADTAETPQDRARHLVDAFYQEINSGRGRWSATPRELDAGKAMLEVTDGVVQRELIRVVMDRNFERWDYRWDRLLSALLARKIDWTAEGLEHLLGRATDSNRFSSHMPAIVRHTRRFLESGHSLTPEMKRLLQEKHKQLTAIPNVEAQKTRQMIGEIWGDDGSTSPDPGETWADLALKDLAAMPEAERQAWRHLLGHLQMADGSKPSQAWRKEAAARVAAVGENFVPPAIRWMEAVTTPNLISNTHTYPNGGSWTSHESGGSDRNISILKGLAWACVDRTEPEAARALGKMTEGCLKKLAGIGPWAIRAASAAVWCLSEMPCPESAAILSRLKSRLTYRATLTQVERALEQVAQRQGVTKEDLEDLAVPTFGLGADGRRQEVFTGGYSAEMAITPEGDISLTIFGPGGKVLKSAPAALKQAENADDWKALKADADAAGKALTAEKQRFDGFALAGRVWELPVWRERFVEHPLLGHLTRRLIWRLTAGDRTFDGLWDDTIHTFLDSEGHPIEAPTDADTEVRLWHPVQSPIEEVIRWRDLLETRQIRQPFKQAHREVYLLTAAEESTRTYSNRYAGHILKQHQFSQLAALRGWKNQLRLMVDDSYEPARRELPQYNLRAEFWVEGIGDNYGTDTTDAGTYLYLTTDQVRFYPIDARANLAHAGGGGYTTNVWARDNSLIRDPLPLADIDPLAFSEIMRDVDLFVGVASVGNDPNWSDGGPEGRHRDYWYDYSFGELSATAQTRREVLAKLLPRLKIRDRATLDGRFLIVRGDIRTYKIHLGSGNILMEPNDQYLCIVQDRSAGKDEAAGANGLFLPFEGDQRLSLILSKAFLLSEDKKITDTTILRQIGG